MRNTHVDVNGVYYVGIIYDVFLMQLYSSTWNTIYPILSGSTTGRANEMDQSGMFFQLTRLTALSNMSVSLNPRLDALFP